MNASPADFRNRRLWSLWDMLRFHADRFVKSLNDLTKLETILTQDPKWVFDPERVKMFARRVGELVDELEDMGLSFTLIKARELHFTVLEPHQGDPKIVARVCNKYIENLRERLADELGSRVYYYVSAHSQYLEPDRPLFGTDVATKFSAAEYDISEAGKCLALARSTACAFHLMRVVELGIQRLAAALKVTVNPKAGWQKILNDGLEPAINGLPEGTDQERERKRELQQCRGHLHAVRLGWRNDTVHPKETYTEEEAERLFRHVETFMRHLAEHL